MTESAGETTAGLGRKRYVRARAAAGALALLLICATTAFSQAPTNLQIMEAMLDSSMVPLLDSLAISKTSPLVLEVQPRDDERTWFVQTRLLRRLAELGFENVAVERSAGTEGSRLALRVDRLAVAFRRVADASDLLQREVSLQISGWLQRSDGVVLWGGVLEKTRVDTIPRGELARVEESPYEFTYDPGLVRSAGRWGWIESAGIAAALGLITYLFYSYRTR